MDRANFDYIYSQLTTKQLEVLDLFIAGRSDEEISINLKIKKETVRKHISDICLAFFDSQQRNSRTQLMRLCTQYLNNQNHAKLTQRYTAIAFEVPSITLFFGRINELELIEQYIIEDQCRLLSIIGMGGIGKTTLLAQWIKKIKNEFEFVLWQSLKVPIKLNELLKKWLILLDSQPSDKISLPDNLSDRITLIIDYLQTRRCLLVLDNFESIMQEGRTGSYCQGYEEYKELLERVWQSEHESCLVITSREHPSEINYPENMQAVRTLRLTGLQLSDVQQIFAGLGSFSASDNEWQELIEYYAGNPLKLRIIARFIQERFNGHISQFIQENLRFGFLNQIRELFDVQFSRLSELEKEIVYWLSINRESMTLQELQQDIVTIEAQQNLIDSVDSLKSRSLIEDNPQGLTLQPVIMKYATEHFINQVVQELQEGNLRLFDSHPLVKATNPDYIRDIQIDLFVQPILQRLIRHFGGQRQVEKHLKIKLNQLTDESPTQPILRGRGYASGNLLNLFRYLGTDLNGYNFSPLTIRQTDLCNLKLQNVNFNNSHIESCLFSSPLGGILWVVFSPSGDSLAAGDVSGNLHLWEVCQDKFINYVLVPRYTFEGHDGWIWTIRFSPDEKYLASAGDEHHVRIWDLQTQECVRTLQGHNDSIRSLSFSCDGILASASDDGTIKLWDIETGVCVCTLIGHQARVRSLSFNPLNKNLLATASDDETVSIWDIHNRKIVQIFRGHSGTIRTVCFSPNGELVASAGNDKTVRLWDVKTGGCRVLAEHTNWVRSVDFNDDGQLLLSASEDQTVKLWNTQSGECIKTFREHSSWVQSVRFSPDGNKFASGSADRTVKLWDVSQGCLSTIQGYTNCLFTVGFSPDGKILASGYEDKTIRLWNLATWEFTTLQGHLNWVRSVTFSSDGKLLASSSGDRTVRLWHLESGECRIFQGHTSWIRQVRFSPDNRYLVSCSDDRTIKVWSIATGKNLHTLEGHQGWVRSLAFTYDGKLLASASGDSTLKLWNSEDICNTHCIQTLNGHDDWVWSVAFAPNGKLLASAGDDSTVKIWHVNSNNIWENCQTLQGHTKSVRVVAFSPDGKTLASGGVDRTLCLWDTQTWEQIGEPREQTDWIRSLVFNSQGHLAIASQDGMIQLWDIQQDSVTTIRLPNLYEGMDIRNTTGLSAAQIQSLRTLGAKVR